MRSRIALQSITIPLQAAAKRPLDTETLAAQLGRLGDTRYELASLDNQLEGDCHFPLSALNQLRRDLVAKLENGAPASAASPSPITTTFRDLLPEHSKSEIQRPNPTCPFSAGTSINSTPPSNAAWKRSTAISKTRAATRTPSRIFKSNISNPKSKILLATPRILKPGETGYLKLIENAAPDGLLLRNLAALQLLQGSQ